MEPLQGADAMTTAIQIETCLDCGACKHGVNRQLTGHAAWCGVAGRDLPYRTVPKFVTFTGVKHKPTYVIPEWCPRAVAVAPAAPAAPLTRKEKLLRIAADASSLADEVAPPAAPPPPA